MIDDADLQPLPTDDEDTLWEKIHLFTANRLGITSILYGFTHTRHMKDMVALDRCFLIRHSHPQDWLDRFGSASFLENDLCAVALIVGACPFLWHRALEIEDATPLQKAQARIDHEFGMDVGVSLVFHFSQERGTAGMGLAARWMDPKVFEERWNRERDTVMEYVARFEPLMRRQMVANRLKLTQRQQQVLAFSAAGFLVKEIADLMKIKEGTVYNYLEAARAALRSSTTLEAVAKAYVYELI